MVLSSSIDGILRLAMARIMMNSARSFADARKPRRRGITFAQRLAPSRCSNKNEDHDFA
jgi:hypothetical protein